MVNLGAHHGLLGRRLRRLPGIELVIDMEHAARLLAQCEGPRVQADEEALPFAGESFDLVVSGLALQFVNDLPGTLLQVRRALKPDGLLLAAMLGAPRSMNSGPPCSPRKKKSKAAPVPCSTVCRCAGPGRPAPARRFRFARRRLRNGHGDYADPLALMRELRAMGAANALLARKKVAIAPRHPDPGAGNLRGSVRSRQWADTRNLRDHHADGLGAAQSQQKPLPPGSAKTRLADALGAVEQPAGEPAPGVNRNGASDRYGPNAVNPENL